MSRSDPTGQAAGAVVAMLRGAVVRFGDVTVLHGVDLTLRAGEVHALVGQNGAGKSTLVKALIGVNRLASGRLEIDGAAVAFTGPQDGRRAGLEIVFQDQPLAAHLTVLDNMFLGREQRGKGPLMDRHGMRRTAEQLLKQIGADCSPDDLVDELTPTQRVQVSIAAALAARPRVLVLDEPTAALGTAEAAPVFHLIRSAIDQGVAVLYISHRLGEITALAQHITVMRDGRVVRSAPAGDLGTDEMITAMVGRELTAMFPERARGRGAVVLHIDDLRSGSLVSGIDLDVRAGEIIGLAGLVGSGASEALLALFGDRRASGQVTIDGQDARAGSPRAAVAAGMAMVPEERRTEALFAGLGVRENLTAASLHAHGAGWMLRRSAEERTAVGLIDRLGIMARDPEQDVGTLSGGNQQKVVVGRWLTRGGRVYLVDEPTAGVDVGAKMEIYRQLGDLAAAGAAVLVVSSDFEELIGLCDGILVVRDGRVTQRVDPGEVDVESLTALAADTRHDGRDRHESGTEPTDRVVPTAPNPSRRRLSARRIGVPAVMIAVLAVLAIGAPTFVSAASLLEVLRQASTPVLLAAALSIALGAGAFDLSVGAVAQLTANVSAALVVGGLSPVLAVLVGIVGGAAIGAVNGVLTAVLRVPSFVATLGMLFLLVGATLGVNHGLSTAVQRSSSFLLLGQGWTGPMPVIAVWSFVVVAIAGFLWRLTAIGLRLRAVGDDAGIARLRGVKVRLATLVALTASGAISGLAGVLMASYSSGSTARDASLSLLVSALAAAFLGSAMTRGMLFDPATAAVGALFVTAVGVGLLSNGLSDQLLAGVQGAALLLAVLVAVVRRRPLGQVAIF